LTTLTAPKPTPSTTAAPATEKATTPPLWARYVGAMLYFMGAALIAGGVVHYPINPMQYTIICIVGAVVFALGTVFNEFVLAPERPTVRAAVWAVAISLVLSFGVGLAGGGIQHFDQFPERCAIMTPLGLAMSFIAYVAKDPEGNWRSIFGRFGAIVAGVVVATWLGMSALAATIDSTGHDHGTANSSVTESTGTNGVQSPTPADQETAGDGHMDHSH
jgi:hypothetical protein